MSMKRGLNFPRREERNCPRDCRRRVRVPAGTKKPHLQGSPRSGAIVTGAVLAFWTRRKVHSRALAKLCQATFQIFAASVILPPHRYKRERHGAARVTKLLFS